MHDSRGCELLCLCSLWTPVCILQEFGWDFPKFCPSNSYSTLSKTFFLAKLLISHKTIYGNIVPEKGSHVNARQCKFIPNATDEQSTTSPWLIPSQLASRSGHLSVGQAGSDPGSPGDTLFKKSVHSPTSRHHMPRNSHLILK